MKILIIEDEVNLANSIEEYLEEEGHICELAYDFKQAKEKIDSHAYESIVVDINLPDGSGLDLISYIKEKNISNGIIIISARNSLENRIEGLEIGADSYLTKPFHLSELNAQLKSINRRINFSGNNEIIFNEIRLLPDEFKVFIHEKELILTSKEYDLLQFFIANKNKVITKTGLAEHLWGDYMDSADSFDFIYTHIKNLRKKLISASCSDYIKTVYRVGYKFEAEKV
ncbi:MAG: response regulator transcription factor [Bacteroidetes bacterium]|nr:response regulator transcription factor [Bacteroidota bacterium]MBT4730335.1 response regulator transcription factor [Bacteroidota bacterium]MBT5992322.1 response regulator transcription factor [Bacteroidota bacterium]MBT6835857.1 response regulator transcription factor [Bacteroidota bacterium]MBT7826889.1 response regulator transcription factor [Bacteroidota bacterium]